MEPGTYAVDPDHFGPPWRRWAEVDAEEAEARGWYAPVYSLSFGPRGATVIAPGDMRGTAIIAGRTDGLCCGWDGRDGPNLACARCGLPVATRVDDCSLWPAVWLDPEAVYRVPCDDSAPRQVIGWDGLPRERPGTPPVEPDGTWSPLWTAAAAAALAHLLAVSGGVRVSVPDGLVADTFRRSLDTLLPPGPPARAMTLAGPGLPAVATDIAVVPQHPQTGEQWPSPGSRDVVPLAFDVWTYLAFHHDRRPVPGAGTVPGDARRDDPLPRHPLDLFRPYGPLFVRTLARLPEVRQPWLRAIYDEVNERPHSALL